MKLIILALATLGEPGGRVERKHRASQASRGDHHRSVVRARGLGSEGRLGRYDDRAQGRRFFAGRGDGGEQGAIDQPRGCRRQ